MRRGMGGGAVSNLALPDISDGNVGSGKAVVAGDAKGVDELRLWYRADALARGEGRCISQAGRDGERCEWWWFWWLELDGPGSPESACLCE